MPLPLIIGGLLALGAGTVAVKAAREVNEDYADELNSIVAATKELCEKTNGRINEVKEKFDLEQQCYNAKRQAIADTTLKSFVEFSSCLKKVDFGMSFERRDSLTRFQTQHIDYSGIITFHLGKESTVLSSAALAATVGAPIVVAASFVQGIKIMTQIDEAKAEYEKIRAKTKAAEIQCDKLESLIKLMERFRKVGGLLDTMTIELLKNARKITTLSGFNYSKYSLEQRQAIRTLYNFALALNDLTLTDIILENDSVNPQFQRFLGEAIELTERQE